MKPTQSWLEVIQKARRVAHWSERESLSALLDRSMAPAPSSDPPPDHCMQPTVMRHDLPIPEA